MTDTPTTGSIESPELHEFRMRARAWLADNLRRLDPSEARELEDDPRSERVARGRELQAKIFEGGFAGLTYPREYGGQGLTLDHERVYWEEAAPYETPNTNFEVSLNILGPTLVAFGTEEQKTRHVRKILSGEELWLQLLSEPSGGSDLAGLLTRAVRDGDSYVLNGQKTWSTGAQNADFAMCPARTAWDVPKHKGITVFILDMHAPGVEIRPIKQINGGEEFCEEFLTDVAVPAGNVIGSENEGWRVARGLLEIEHSWVGRRPGGGRSEQDGVTELVALARRYGLDDDPGVRREIASVHVSSRVHGWAAQRVSNGMAAGNLPQGYGGILKLGNDVNQQRRAELALALAGSSAVAWSATDPTGRHAAMDYLSSRSLSIAGGTDEIQRNNASERGLGLPREPASDRDVPFNEVPHN